MDNCTPYCIYLHTTNIRVTGVVYSNVSGRWYAQMYNNLKLFDYGEKIYKQVMLPKGDKTLVRNSDNCVVATFPPNTARFECKEWDKYLRTHKEVRDSFELKYDCMMMFECSDK